MNLAERYIKSKGYLLNTKRFHQNEYECAVLFPKGKWIVQEIKFTDELMEVNIHSNFSLDIVNSNEPDVNIKEVANDFMEMWLELFKHSKKKLLNISGDVIYVFGYDVTNEALKLGYKTLNKEQSEITKMIGEEFFGLFLIYYEKTDNLLSHYTNMLGLAYREFEKIRKLNKTMSVKWDYENGNMEMYYKGLDVLLTFGLNNKNCIFTIEKRSYSANSLDEIKIVVQVIMEDIENKTKLRNLYHPPRKYFDKFWEREFWANPIKDSQEIVHKCLLERYNWEEIENGSFDYLYNIEKIKYDKEETSVIVEFLKNYLVIDLEDKLISIYEKEESKKAMEDYITLSFKKRRESIMERLEKKLKSS